MIDIEAIRKVCDAATEGPWESFEKPTNTDGVLVFCAAGFPVADMDVVWNRPAQQRLADAHFIALARTALPAALDELAELRKENERLKGDRALDDHNLMALGEVTDSWEAEAKSLRAERDQLRAECERLRAERDGLAKELCSVHCAVCGCVNTEGSRAFEDRTAEKIAACLERAEGNVAQGMGVDHDVQTLQGYYYRRAAMVIRSMAWRTPGSDSRGGG